ncbi:MAG: peptide deformylase [Spirochaetia bacterium]|nr:peptide deformylase [Spirochaetia bacterium]
MAIRKIITLADSVLYRESEKVDKFNSELRDLIRDMFDTMYDESGVGLAAVQIGVLKRVIIIDLEHSGFIKGVFINPEVVFTSSEMQFGEEGCLSVPGVTANLSRPKHIRVAYQNMFGERLEIEGSDLLARALLHEIDHINGKVFVDQLEFEERQKVENDIQEVKKGRRPEHFRKPNYR